MRALRVAAFSLCLAASLFLALDVNVATLGAVDPTDCEFCHGSGFGSNNHPNTWQGCASCHGFPPDSASHRKHVQNESSELYRPYGDLSITQDVNPNASSYEMGCGNCHPLDNTRHMDGKVDIELYNAALSGVVPPDTSLKAKNLSTATYTKGSVVSNDTAVTAIPGMSTATSIPYTNGTCSNIYCHSYNDWATNGPVPDQGTNASVPANLVTTRMYQTPTWGDSLTCTGCHGNPPRTTFFTNDGGAGNSHSWLDAYGYENLHTYNHDFSYFGATPLLCMTCHNSTVSDASAYTVGNILYNGMTFTDVVTFNDTAIGSHAKHVNGVVDVAFDTQNTYRYRNSFSLLTASYDPSTKTCSNVSCHQQQTSVPWGAPYRWYYNNECDRCHRY